MRSLHMHIMMIFMMKSLMILMIFSWQIRRMWAVAVEAHVTSITFFFFFLSQLKTKHALLLYILISILRKRKPSLVFLYMQNSIHVCRAFVELAFVLFM